MTFKIEQNEFLSEIEDKKARRKKRFRMVFWSGCFIFIIFPVALSAFFALFGAELGEFFSNIAATLEATPAP